MNDGKPEPTSPEVADAIEALHTALLNEYEGDFAFTILGKGRIISASNMIHGIVQPVVRKEGV